MRDGVRLHLVLLVPHGATRAPILLTRTPYGTDSDLGSDTTTRFDDLMWPTSLSNDPQLLGDRCTQSGGLVLDERGRPR